jgi:hypothetical protein
MVAIRNKQHARPVDITFYNAWPLPSAGFVPLMQSFCKPENGVRNEFGFLEYPNSTAKEMIEKIEKILKSNWSSTWFSNASSTISPFFQDDQATENLNQLSAKLIEITRNNTSLNENEKNNIKQTLENSKNRYVALNKIVKLKKNSSKFASQLSNKNVVVDLYELYLYSSGKQLTNSQNFFEYTLNSMPTNDKNNKRNNLEKQTRLDLMHDFFCDKENFNKILNSTSNSQNNRLDQDKLCNMTPEELNELDDELILDKNFNEIYMVNHKPPIMDASYLSDLNQKLKNFIDFQVCV